MEALLRVIESTLACVLLFLISLLFNGMLIFFFLRSLESLESSHRADTIIKVLVVVVYVFLPKILNWHFLRNFRKRFPFEGFSLLTRHSHFPTHIFELVSRNNCKAPLLQLENNFRANYVSFSLLTITVLSRFLLF